jgi:hypothetical protein
MFSAMLFVISMVALAQFALYYWRAMVAGVAAQPISVDVLEAVQSDESKLCGADFGKLASLLRVTPELKHRRGGLGLVPMYFQTVRKLSELFGQFSPALARWSAHEQALCARYAAVRVGLRLEANLAQAESMRSY